MLDLSNETYEKQMKLNFLGTVYTVKVRLVQSLKRSLILLVGSSSFDGRKQGQRKGHHDEFSRWISQFYRLFGV